MGLIKKYWKEIIIGLLIGVLIFFFPLTNKDWFWFNNFSSINHSLIANLSNYQFVPALLAVLLSKIKILKIIGYTISFITFILLMKNIINKNNKVLTYLSIFLFFLLKDDIIFTSFISPYGFCMNFVPIILCLLITYLLLEDTLYKISKPVLFIIGLVSCIFSGTYSLLIFTILMINLIRLLLKKEKDNHFMIMFTGSLIGNTSLLVYNIINKNIAVNNISGKLLHEIIPNIYSMDFIISLILISFILFLSIKVYLSNARFKKFLTVCSLISILLYSLARILSTNDLLNYISFVLFEVVSVFILINSNNRLHFKKRIYMFYILKWLYLFILLLGNISISSMLFIEIINILVIISIVDYIFPKNFLTIPWYIISISILLLNIYLFRGTNIKTIEMDRYIKNHIDCNMLNVYLPHKYYNSYIKYLLPVSKEEKREYLVYLDTPGYSEKSLDNIEYKIIYVYEK